jgi:ubiquinone/menaquinone biosynthesis C-methylase UbiE
MKTAEELRRIVKEKYEEIVEKSYSKKSCCCCSPQEVDFAAFSSDYSQLKGYNPDANLNLGCGLPTQYAKIKMGNIVVDLGAGAGNDCFVARALVGDQGKVIGIDFTEKMIFKAKENARKLGYTNVEFVYGEIENIPLPDNTADVVVSNCVMNLVPSKEKAFKETYRILKKGGHFSISDIVIEGQLPDKIREEAFLYAGCVSGAININEYLGVIRKAGFINIEIQQKVNNNLPENVFLKYMSRGDWDAYIKKGFGIFSITVFAEK